MSAAEELRSAILCQSEVPAPAEILAPREEEQRVAPHEERYRGQARRSRRARLEQENARLLATIRKLLDRSVERGDELRRLSGLSALQNQALRSLNHECRSPLQSIFGMTTLLLRRFGGNLNDEPAQLVHLIRKAADDLVELIDDFTEPERLGQTPVRLASFAAEDLLRTLQGMLPAPLIHRDVALVFAAGENIPPLVSDQRKVLQILRNLVNNALKFTARGEVRVGVAYDRATATVVFSVQDTGPGIPYERQKELALPPARGVECGGPAPRRGLGLPLCHSLAAALGGRIALESVPGSGSKFSLLVPQRRSGAEAHFDDGVERLSRAAAAAIRTDGVHEER